MRSIYHISEESLPETWGEARLIYGYIMQDEQSIGHVKKILEETEKRFNEREDSHSKETEQEFLKRAVKEAGDNSLDGILFDVCETHHNGKLIYAIFGHAILYHSNLHAKLMGEKTNVHPRYMLACCNGIDEALKRFCQKYKIEVSGEPELYIWVNSGTKEEIGERK